MMYAEYLTCDFLDKCIKVEITRRFRSFVRVSDRVYRIIERFTSSIEIGNVEVITRESVTRTVFSFLSVGDDLARNCSSTRVHKLILRLELYLPYAPLPGGGGILPAVSGSGASGGCRPVLLGGVDLSMSAAVQPPGATLPTNLTNSGPIAAHNSLHHTSGGGLALPPLGAAAGPPVMMPRPPPGAMPPLGPTLPPTHQDEDLADAAPNQDVLLALLARNKNLEEISYKYQPPKDDVKFFNRSFCDPEKPINLWPAKRFWVIKRAKYYFYLIHLLRDIENLRPISTLELAFAQWMAAKIQRLRNVYTWEHKPEASGLFSLEACSPIAYHIG
ncbi:hypothetical protein ALC57_15945 [Trachymyrmex cornetzi]|uniref:Uncharacterized protein n=1 Tax=Trachymyrmex cornetzi TaxID=471704 RepID=A0A195DH65_9HYME|nr:hypothetical protein ALC57_15945 [Trachymyrmex cornetzi]